MSLTTSWTPSAPTATSMVPWPTAHIQAALNHLAAGGTARPPDDGQSSRRVHDLAPVLGTACYGVSGLSWPYPNEIANLDDFPRAEK